MAKMYKKQIYVSNYIGLDENSKPLYAEPIAVYVFISSPDSNITSFNIGVVETYDRKISLDIGANTEFINKQTRMWIDTIPNNNNTNMDYKIARMGDIVNRTFSIYVNRQSSDTSNLYYSNDDTNIVQVKVVYDNLTKTAIVPKNMYLPININSKVWYKKPLNTQVITRSLTFVSKELINNSYKITFE